MRLCFSPASPRVNSSATHVRTPTSHRVPPTAFDLAATNGVVLATEKKLPSVLVDEASVEKIQHFTGNIGELGDLRGQKARTSLRYGQPITRTTEADRLPAAS